MKYLISVLCLLPLQINAVEYDVGIGYTQTSDPPNGRWYQEEFDYRLMNDSWSGHLGLVFDISDNLNVLVGYKYLGTFKSDAIAVGSDYNYAQWRANEADLWPTSQWRGKGTAQGLYLVGEYHFKYFFVRLGGWAHKATWNMKIDDWRPWDIWNIEGCEVQNSGDSSNCYGTARYLEVNADDSIQYSYTFGIGKQFDHILITYEVWDIKSERQFWSTYHGEAHNLSLSYRF